MHASVLIVDDVPANRTLLQQTLEPQGWEVMLAPDGETALKVANKTRPDLIFLDVIMPGLNGFETCRQLKANPATKEIPVIFITAQEDSRSIVEGLQAGAIDYITKPIRTEEVLARAETHLKVHRLTAELRRKNDELIEEIRKRQTAEHALQQADEQLSILTEQEAERWGLKGFVGQSPTFAKVVEAIRRVHAAANTSVLITGESGTGKELIARAIHFGGGKARGPFVPVNCTAIPRDMAESFLFGHVKGAFTGAISDRKGYFEQAHGGTLFLDEIGDMSPALQAQLLRVLEDRVVVPVGATQPRPISVRVVAATNADLQSDIAAGAFRSDLYFRLAAYTIEVPPLRERKEDIPLLVRHFVARFSAEMGMNPPEVSQEATLALQSHVFPGNIRELRNLVERALIDSGGGPIRAGHVSIENIPAKSTAAVPTARAKLSPDEEKIIAYIREHGAINNTQCREVLGVGMQRACYLLRKLHLSGHLLRDSSGRWAEYRFAHPC